MQWGKFTYHIVNIKLNQQCGLICVVFTFTYHIVNIKHTAVAYALLFVVPFTYHIVNIKRMEQREMFK